MQFGEPMKLCPTCGRQYKDETVFCLEDGSALETIVPQAEYQGGQFSPTPQPQKKSYGLLIGLIVVILLGFGAVLAAGLVGAYFYFRSDNGDIATGSPSPTPTLPPFGSDFPTPSPSPTRSPSPTPTASPSPDRSTPTPTPDDIPDDDDDVPTLPTAPTPPNIPKQISGGVLNGKATSMPKPPYPPAARAVRAQGIVLVQVIVDVNGNVITANAVSGHPLLKEAAAQAARGAKFEPTKLAGQPVRVSGILTYNFTP